MITGAVRATMLALLGLVALGCSGVLYKSPERVGADVEAHLQSMYGEPFVVTYVNNQSNEGVGIIDVHTFRAHPTARPDVLVSGSADYDVDPPRFEDDFRCTQALPALWQRFDQALRDRELWVRSRGLRCKNEALAPLPDPGEKIPEAFHFTGDLYSFAEGDSLELTKALQGQLDALGAEAGVQVEPASYRFLERGLLPLLPHLSHDDDFASYERAYARMWRGEWQQGTDGLFSAISTQLAEELRADAAGRIEVRVRPSNDSAHAAWREDPGSPLAALPEGARLFVNVRLAAPSDLDGTGVETLVRRIRQRFKPHRLTVHLGLYDDPAAPTPDSYQGGWACTGFLTRCERVESYLIGPAVDSPEE